ncbi:uncharacterized protein V6R79_001272 [Siganus canaliculatus]
MDCRANSDMLFLPDEKFDFDVSLSPASSKGDESEDEVFVGPVSHKEKCVSVNVVSRLEDCGHSVRTSWSPLTGDQLEAVCQEAHRLADQLQNGELSQPPGGGVREDDDKKIPSVTTDATSNKEVFVQDVEAKLGVLDQAATVLSPIKRQTFCVQDSPMKQLPPAVQRRLLKGSSSSSTAPPARHSSASTNSLIRPAASTRLSTSSPVAAAKTQPRTGLRGRTSMGVAAVLPSKPAAPTASCSSSKTRVERTRLQPPSKAAVGRRRSPASHPTRRAESSEDLLSDSASVASDVSDCSLNSSLQGKRTLAPPTKNGVRTATGVKAPALQSRRMTDRKNTSSSSSSVSSFNSSLSLSPAKGKLNSSLNRSASSSAVPAPSSVGKPANAVKPRRSTVYGTAEPPSSSTSTAASRRSVSVQARKPSEVERVKTGRSTPLKRAEATPLQVTPAKRGAPDRKASIPSAAPSSAPLRGLKPKTKPEAPVAPTPNGVVRGVSHGDDASKMMKPKRLMSASSVDSLPLTPSAGGCKSLQLKTRRPSALPTPVRRRASALPVATPNNKPRLARPPPTCDSDPAPSPASVSRDGSCSPAPAGVQELEPADAAPEIQPFCLEEEEQKEEEEPAADAPPTTTSPTQPDQSESTAPEAPSQVESAQPIKNLIELETAEESNRTTQEVLLLDLPAPTLPPQEKLLIDLTNTPNLIRNSNKSCTGAQLIDLSSPLIKWSPEDKRENNAPLINLSF